MTDGDSRLLREIKRGSQRSFETLFRRYYQPLVIFSNYFIRNAEHAEDIVQELFSRLWEQRETINIESSVKNYLFRSVKNSTLNFVKYDSKFIRNENTRALIDELHSLDPIDIDELEIEVINALNKLPPRAREIFLLHYREGYTYEEIAQILGISKNTVKTHMLRSRGNIDNKILSLLYIIPFLME